MYVIDTKMDYPKTRSNINKSLRFMDIDDVILRYVLLLKLMENVENKWQLGNFRFQKTTS